ncbi:MAG: hypothetical protein E7445_05985 [Ruminococcaceae bacterium]|nr:hypothetical protein [Oscillospiraceae bacterium]
MTMRDIWNNMAYRFCFWLIAALLAYRTAPDTGYGLAVSVLTGIVYLVMWVFLVLLDARGGKRFSGLMGFMLVLMALMTTTFVLVRNGLNITVIALFWLVPVGMPLQGIVRMFSDAASRADDSMALVSVVLLAALLVLRTILCRKKTKSGE